MTDTITNPTITGDELRRQRWLFRLDHPPADEEGIVLALGGGHSPFPSDDWAAWKHLVGWHHLAPEAVENARKWGYWHGQVHGHWNRDGWIDRDMPRHGHRPHSHRR